MYLSSIGIVEICSRLIYAIFLVDSSDVVILLSASFIGDGIGVLLLCLPTLTALQAKSQFIIPIAILVLGFFNAGFGGVMNATLVKILPSEKFAVGMGMYQLAMGFGNALGPLLGGAIVDAVRASNAPVGNSTDLNVDDINIYADPYWASFIFGAAACMIPGGLVILILKKWY